eukprot:1306890-Pyramimonas_sp.AAC.1
MPVECGFSDAVGGSNTEVAGLAQGSEARAVGVLSILGSLSPTVGPLLRTMVPSVSRWQPKSLFTSPPITIV